MSELSRLDHHSGAVGSDSATPATWSHYRQLRATFWNSSDFDWNENQTEVTSAISLSHNTSQLFFKFTCFMLVDFYHHFHCWIMYCVRILPGKSVISLKTRSVVVSTQHKYNGFVNLECEVPLTPSRPYCFCLGFFVSTEYGKAQS